ncbi:MAG: large conductance mechanosensitive channel protein MscL [Trueperaceae bacterium]|jgi:large conductance mechanosensitive channel|nr:large conductance mechanosensitive channel protein MscL [Truepera sp.]HRN18149.1 large conductance mechanosensitive channel protein MscL [Trueperaceae bacterium]HRQ10684.1 large conductance mechanosensitive channel protein MscL [Trueperaceae bacterium]
MIKEFRDFINRGNVLDLAVAVIIGGAFGAITTSLVNQVVMPVIGLILGGVDFSNLGIILSGRDQYASVAEAVAAGAPVIQYGAFLNTVINFLLIALVLFFIVKAFNDMKKRFEKPAPPAAPAAPTAEVKLLTEIRDALKEK